MPFGWGIVSTGKHPDVKIAPAMAEADGGELVGVYSGDSSSTSHQPRRWVSRGDPRGGR